MSTVLIVAAVLAAWCIAPLPLAVAVGRAFRDGHEPARASEDVVRRYEAAGA